MCVSMPMCRAVTKLLQTIFEEQNRRRNVFHGPAFSKNCIIFLPHLVSRRCLPTLEAMKNCGVENITDAVENLKLLSTINGVCFRNLIRWLTTDSSRSMKKKLRSTCSIRFSWTKYWKKKTDNLTFSAKKLHPTPTFLRTIIQFFVLHRWDKWLSKTSSKHGITFSLACWLPWPVAFW